MVVFAIHSHESVMGVHVFPILTLPSTSLPIPSCFDSLPYRCITYCKKNFFTFKKNLASPTGVANFYFLDEPPKTCSWQYPEMTAASWTHCYGSQPSGAPLTPAHLPSLCLLLWSYIISEPPSSF